MSPELCERFTRSVCSCNKQDAFVSLVIYFNLLPLSFGDNCAAENSNKGLAITKGKEVVLNSLYTRVYAYRYAYQWRPP